MKGKSKCKILKDIRKQIAKENDIEFITSECNYKGDCLGTCPKCEAEVRYLESELEKRKSAGKKIAVAGIAAAFALSAASCDIDDVINSALGTTAGVPDAEISREAINGQLPSEESYIKTPENSEESDECEIELDGDIAPPEYSYGEEAVIGEVAEP